MLHMLMPVMGRNPLSLDMGWKRRMKRKEASRPPCRNPLSLDMGWKSRNHGRFRQLGGRSQSACARYEVKSITSKNTGGLVLEAIDYC